MHRLTLLVVALLISPRIWACGCGSPNASAEVKPRSPDVVFKGVVVSVATAHVNQVTIQNVKFRVTERVRGRRMNEITVEFRNGETSCDPKKTNFQEGQTYTLSANRQKLDVAYWKKHHPVEPMPPEQFGANLCNLLQLMSGAGDTVNQGNLFRNPILL